MKLKKNNKLLITFLVILNINLGTNILSIVE